MAQSIIVYGPQGCGKSRYAEPLAAHYGLRKIIDDEGPLDRLTKRHREDALILVQAETPDELDANLLAGRYRVVSFHAALAEAGIDAGQTPREKVWVTTRRARGRVAFLPGKYNGSEGFWTIRRCDALGVDNSGFIFATTADDITDETVRQEIFGVSFDVRERVTCNQQQVWRHPAEGGALHFSVIVLQQTLADEGSMQEVSLIDQIMAWCDGKGGFSYAEAMRGAGVGDWPDRRIITDLRKRLKADGYIEARRRNEEGKLRTGWWKE